MSQTNAMLNPVYAGNYAGNAGLAGNFAGMSGYTGNQGLGSAGKGTAISSANTGWGSEIFKKL